MGKRKPPKRATPPKLPAGEKVLASSSSESPACTGSTDSLQVSIEAPTSQRTASVSNFQDPISVPVTGSEDPNTVITVNSAKVILVTDPAKTPTCEDKEEGEISPTKSNLITEKDDAILDKTRNFVLASVPTTDNTATAKSAPPAVEEVENQTSDKTESASSFKKMEIGETSGKVESSARGSIDRASSDLGGLEMSAAESDSSDLDSSDSRKAWLLIGDFNQVLKPEEHSCPPTLNVDRQTRDFQDCVSDAALSDLNFIGPTFSWWNSQKANPIGKKLDRILVNDQWHVQFPSSLGIFGPQEFSDHASCSVILATDQTKHRMPFKFYNFLLLDSEFLPMDCRLASLDGSLSVSPRLPLRSASMEKQGGFLKAPEA
ncbi:hypothetical protein YC2023_028318 [Brassica napus]